MHLTKPRYLIERGHKNIVRYLNQMIFRIRDIGNDACYQGYNLDIDEDNILWLATQDQKFAFKDKEIDQDF